MAPLYLITITYTTRYLLKKDLETCWFEPSFYEWIIHGPNVVLQIVSRIFPLEIGFSSIIDLISVQFSDFYVYLHLIEWQIE